MQVEPTASPATPRRRCLNLALRPPKRGYVRMSIQLDPALWVKWTAFQASVEARTGHGRVDRHGLAGAALMAFMRQHRAWEAS